MGRNNKADLQYFPMNIDILRDTKIRRLTRAYPRGMEFYVYLLCAIYSDKGYYLPIDDQTAFDIADDLRISEVETNEMLEFCMSDSVGLFSREMMDRHNILTSRGIQERYSETIRQLKRKVCISSEYLLLNTDDARNDSEEMDFKPDKNQIGSEEMPITSEEIGVNSEEMGIYSDKSKVEESRIKENKIEEISLSAAGAKERESFLKILLFEKNLLDPLQELERFESHYEKTGWVDANGNPIKNRLAALKAWSPDKSASKLPSVTVKIWQEIYEATEGDKMPLLTDFRGFFPDGQGLHITASSKDLMDYMEHPDRLKTIRDILSKHFKFGALNYRIARK